MPILRVINSEKGALVDKVSIVLATPVSEAGQKVIRAVDPRVELRDISDLARRDYQGDEHAREEMNAILAGAEVVFGMRTPMNLLARAPKLKWIQVTSAGVDRYLTEEFKKNPVMLTNASGIHATPIGEFIVSLMLMFAKKAPVLFENKQKKVWQRSPGTVLSGKTAGIVGLGDIGAEAARLCKAFHMRVIATRRTVKAEGRAPNVDVLLPSAELPRLLRESDYVAVCTPLTPETRHLIGAKELHMMKPTAYIINIGRGPIIDEEALTLCLQEGRIAGAGLDVFSAEPLPPTSKLWELPNVIISPHVSGGRDDYEAGALEIFCRNLRLYLDGKKLTNLVDKEAGY